MGAIKDKFVGRQVDLKTPRTKNQKNKDLFQGPSGQEPMA